MSMITLKGNPVETIGELPATGSMAPAFTLVGSGMEEVSLRDFEGRNVVLNIFPSLDTAVCATSVRRFNAEASELPDTVVLCISADLPFAHARFCVAEGLDDVVTLSVFRSPGFGRDYGVTMTTGPFAGLLSRAVVVIDADGRIVYTQQVPDIVEEPDYERAIGSVS
jgi:thiol peroxidase